MQFDRFLSRLIGMEIPLEGEPVVRSREAAPRGSGSWANEWLSAELKTLRAKGKAARRHAAVSERVVGVVRTRSFMETGILRLHESLTDRIEAEAPTCTLHSAVAFAAFLTAERNSDGGDRLAGLTADLLVADGAGLPLVAILREDKLHPQRQNARIDVLLDAGMAFVEMGDKPSHGEIWSEVSAHLPRR
jgi:hypothetical protein